MAKILLIEDDQILLGMYKTMFQNHGFAVSTAVNGEEGLSSALTLHPDLILLDIRMQGMDGLTMMQKLREDEWGENAKIIILTNLDINDERLSAIVKHQPSYYLIKANTKPEDVLEKVEETLGS